MAADQTSAPAQYTTPGILRYTSEPLSPAPYNVKFAPLPETEDFGRRRRFNLGVNGRSNILNRKRRNINGINYTQGISSKGSELPPVPDASNAGLLDESRTAKPKESAPEHRIRRSASEEGFFSQQSASARKAKKNGNGKRPGGSWGFWRKSKKPALDTIIASETELPPTVSPAPPRGDGSPTDPAPETSTPQVPSTPKDDKQDLDNSLPNEPNINPRDSASDAVSSSAPATPLLEQMSLEEVTVVISDTSESLARETVALMTETVGGENSDLLKETANASS